MLIIDDCLQTNSDEILCAAVAAGDRVAEETLVMRYNRLVRVCARPFFLVGGDSEDLIQEAVRLKNNEKYGDALKKLKKE